MKGIEKEIFESSIQKYRTLYNSLNFTRIVFGSVGFKHLLYSGRKRRNTKDILCRLSFIPEIPNILLHCPEPVEIRGQQELHGGEYVPVRYYAFESNTQLGRVRLITRQVQEETPRFLSLIRI